MNIAILGWGSLVPDPRGLPIAGGWHQGGPILPIEFSRISKDGQRAGCLTLVIDEAHGSEVAPCYQGTGAAIHQHGPGANDDSLSPPPTRANHP